MIPFGSHVFVTFFRAVVSVSFIYWHGVRRRAMRLTSSFYREIKLPAVCSSCVCVFVFFLFDFIVFS